MPFVFAQAKRNEDSVHSYSVSQDTHHSVSMLSRWKIYTWLLLYYIMHKQIFEDKLFFPQYSIFLQQAYQSIIIFFQWSALLTKLNLFLQGCFKSDNLMLNKTENRNCIIVNYTEAKEIISQSEDVKTTKPWVYGNLLILWIELGSKFTFLPTRFFSQKNLIYFS